LETELAKAREAESLLRLEFDHQLAAEKKILSAEFDSKVEELRATLGSEAERCGAQIDWKLSEGLTVSVMIRRSVFGVPVTARFSPACWDWKFLSVVSFPSCFSALALPCHLLTLTALAGAFLDSNKTAAAALKEYRTEQKIVPSSDPKAELTSGELVALAKG
jgi:hypothetical protein